MIVNKSSYKIPKKATEAVVEKLFKKFVSNAVFKLHRSRDRYLADITIVFLNEKEAKKCNVKYRGKKYATDVLSFVNVNRNSGMGELVLCSQVLKKQAKEHKISFQSEIVYLVIHGFLHLLGYEHETSAKEEKVMLDLQDKLFEAYDKKGK